MIEKPSSENISQNRTDHCEKGLLHPASSFTMLTTLHHLYISYTGVILRHLALMCVCLLSNALLHNGRAQVRNSLGVQDYWAMLVR